MKRLQRCKNSRNESCVRASASKVDIASPVTLRVGPAGTCELIALRGNCELDTEPGGSIISLLCVGKCTDVEIIPFCTC